jgi:hypothetical protein
LALNAACPNVVVLGAGVAGGASSGKSTVCKMIIDQLRDQRVVVVTQVCALLLCSHLAAYVHSTNTLCCSTLLTKTPWGYIGNYALFMLHYHDVMPHLFQSFITTSNEIALFMLDFHVAMPPYFQSLITTSNEITIFCRSPFIMD